MFVITVFSPFKMAACLKNSYLECGKNLETRFIKEGLYDYTL